MSITVRCHADALTALDAELHVAFMAQDGALPQALIQRFPALTHMAAARCFNGAKSATLIAPLVHDKLTYGVVIGLGKKARAGHHDIENFRRAVGTMIRTAQQLKTASIAVLLPDHVLFNCDQQYLLRELTIAAGLAAYEFDHFVTNAHKKQLSDFAITVVECSEDKAHQEAIERGLITVDALNAARSWINTPPNVMYPHSFYEHALEYLKDADLKITVFDKPALENLGMGGILSVSSGSQHEGRLVVVEYRCSDPKAPTIGFVGKGITFDSGGLSIKPSKAMETMKDDMSGAAAVVTAMKVISYLKPQVNVVAMAPLAENLPSGTSNKPGDIIRFYNGKTAEILDTDAEGRLVLADALSYMVDKYKPAALIDVATLTGACVVAVGPLYTGLMSEDEEMVKMVAQAAERGGDPVWRLPMNDDYAAAVEGDVADLNNIGKANYRAGATTAACFLRSFVGDTPWVHLDIAGSSYDVPGISYFRPNTATGSGLRILVEFTELFAQKKK